jgi:hypothetical protein
MLFLETSQTISSRLSGKRSNRPIKAAFTSRRGWRYSRSVCEAIVLTAADLEGSSITMTTYLLTANVIADDRRLAVRSIGRLGGTVSCLPIFSDEK